MRQDYFDDLKKELHANFELQDKAAPGVSIDRLWQLLAYTSAKYVANIAVDRLSIMALNEIDEYLKRYVGGQ